MTLSPVFRSPEAVQVLIAEGIWSRLEPSARGQAEAIGNVSRDLRLILDSRFIDEASLASSSGAEDIELKFVQDFFFLIFFRAVLQTLGIPTPALALCSELNFCIKGTITAADNLFDDQNKTLLPLKTGEGARFGSILQLLAFERLTKRALERGERSGAMSRSSGDQFQKELLSSMAAIGSLEGSEESGVNEILAPERMVEKVHRVRGGALFELAFIAPRLLAMSVNHEAIARAQAAISKLGTAFQIVDDLTDFEFDAARGRHNLLVSQITHCGSTAERERLSGLGETAPGTGDVVTQWFSESARAVIERGETETKQALDELQSLGFWFPPALGGQLLRAIVGLEGVERLRPL